MKQVPKNLYCTYYMEASNSSESTSQPLGLSDCSEEAPPLPGAAAPRATDIETTSALPLPRKCKEW